MSEEDDAMTEAVLREIVCKVIRRALLDWRIYHIAKKRLAKLDEIGEKRSFRRAHIRRQMYEVQDVVAWFDSDSVEPISYLFCCKMFGVDGVKARARIDEIADSLAQKSKYKITEEETDDDEAAVPGSWDETVGELLVGEHTADQPVEPCRATFRSILCALQGDLFATAEAT